MLSCGRLQVLGRTLSASSNWRQQRELQISGTISWIVSLFGDTLLEIPPGVSLSRRLPGESSSVGSTLLEGVPGYTSLTKDCAPLSARTPETSREQPNDNNDDNENNDNNVSNNDDNINMSNNNDTNNSNNNINSSNKLMIIIKVIIIIIIVIMIIIVIII